MKDNTKIHWLVQSNHLACDQVNAVWYAAKEAGCTVHEAIVIPFQDELDNVKDLTALSETDLVIPYGSCKLTRVTNSENWLGHCYSEDTFNVQAWNANRTDMLNQHAESVQVKDISKYFDTIGADDSDMYFIRPLYDLKQFAGTVTSVGEMKKWMNSTESGNFSFDGDTVACISPATKIYSESRFFIVGGKVIDGSLYRMNGRMSVEHFERQPEWSSAPDHYVFAQRLADQWLPHECCVMDVCRTDDGPKVIEFNTINSSGFYKHDITKIVNAMTDWVRDASTAQQEQRKNDSATG